ncbi:hypothetical protein BKD30_00180 [Tersicoccus phoenicis]|uniref:Peroxide stress protein YaaA n=1 Tax=Tersicoccus phoenicis TaxID=554083 RepID=A0A1R1LQ72_9MICC|nr:peroxide stress protein YaaA [Tersicoccus phoenicis]OMH29655.1 hypothetical protein BKD30_00180 [Tersicoccus phoenicis]
MLILLPPSESKRAARSGAPVDLDALAHPALTPARYRVLDELARVSAAPDALAVLGVGPGLADDVARNTRLTTAPAAPAHRVYNGVLYDALDHRSLTAVQRRRAAESVLVVSALWGLVAPTDAIPAYRLSMGTRLGDVGNLASFWRPLLTDALAARGNDELIVDCRSSTYAAAAATPADRTVAVDVVRERDGVRTVVSHMAKHTRGELARHLLTRRGHAPVDAGALVRVTRERWPAAELVPAGNRRPAHLQIVLTD